MYFNDILAYSIGTDVRNHIDYLTQIINRLQQIAGINLSEKTTPVS